MGYKKSEFPVDTRRMYNGLFIVGQTKGIGEDRGKIYFTIDFPLESFHGIDVELEDKFKHKMGIYKISIIEEKSGRTVLAYVGETARGFATRWREHGISIGSVNAAQRQEEQKREEELEKADKIVESFLSPTGFHIAVAKLFAGKPGYKIQFQVLALTSRSNLGIAESYFIDQIVDQYKNTDVIIGNARTETALLRVNAAFNARVPEKYKATAPVNSIETSLLISVVRSLMESRKKGTGGIPYEYILTQLFNKNFMFLSLGMSYAKMVEKGKDGTPQIKEGAKTVIMRSLLAWKEYVDFAITIDPDNISSLESGYVEEIGNRIKPYVPDTSSYNALVALILKNVVIQEAEITFKGIKFNKDRVQGVIDPKTEVQKGRFLIDGVIFGDKGTKKSGGLSIHEKILKDYTDSNEYDKFILDIIDETIKTSNNFTKENRRIYAQNKDTDSKKLLEAIKESNKKDPTVDLFIGTNYNN